MKLATLALALAAAAIAVPAKADDKEMEALAKKHNCFACHQTDKKAIGPAYKDVAKKYKGQKDAQAQLEQKVKKGGVGVWGQIPMPPNAAVPDGDIKKLVDWILKMS
jgi:cytochrome c